jgi:hypothetical protein
MGFCYKFVVHVLSKYVSDSNNTYFSVERPDILSEALLCSVTLGN